MYSEGHEKELICVELVVLRRIGAEKQSLNF
jgi:hypothetical protein